MRMLLAYVLIVFLLHLSASTCYATSRNQHLFFAGRAAADDATALLPAAAAIHHHHHHHHDRHTAKAEVHRLSESDYNDVRHYRPAMMARWPGGAPPRPPSTWPGVELAGIGGAPPPPPSLSLSAVEPSGGEGGAPLQPPPLPGKQQDASAAMEPSSPPPPHGEGGASSSDASATTTGQEGSASGDVDVDDADYDGPMTHPPSHN